MRESRFKDEQIVAMLRDTDRDAVPVAAKRHGVSEQTIYAGKKRFGSFQPDDVLGLKQLKQENGRLKKLVAESDLVRARAAGWPRNCCGTIPSSSAKSATVLRDSARGAPESKSDSLSEF